MNRFVTTALALTAASGAAFAAPNGSDSEWLELDREIDRLAKGYATRGDIGSDIGAVLRVFYGYSDDDPYQNTANMDATSGFELFDVDVWIEGEVGDFGYRVSTDLGSGSANLEDAFVRWSYDGDMSAQAGQFKAHVTRSASLNPENGFFAERSAIGAAFDMWQPGVGASGSFDVFAWFFNVMNGTNSTDKGHFWNFRFEFDLGEGASHYEGAYGGGDDFNATAGFSFFNDDTQSGDASGFVFDFAGSSGPLGFGVEVLSIDDDYTNLGRPDIWTIPSGTYDLERDSTPFSAIVTWAIDEQLEAGLRLQDMDNTDDTTLISLGINYYKSGHNGKWHLSINDMDSDFDDGTFFIAGYSVGSSD